MSSRLVRVAALLTLALGTLASGGCALTHTTPGPEVLAVEAEIASVTLGDDCTGAARGGAGLWAGDCAAEPGAEDGCGFCQQTAVQLHLLAVDPDPSSIESVPVEVVSVRLLDAAGVLVAELSPHELTIWNAETGTYEAWDGTIASGEDLSISVPTTAPDWTAIGGGEPWSTYGMQFGVDLTLRVDGVDRPLDFAPAMREPEIVT